MDSHERLGPNQSAKIEAECLTTAKSRGKMLLRSGSKSLSVFPEAEMDLQRVQLMSSRLTTSRWKYHCMVDCFQDENWKAARWYTKSLLTTDPDNSQLQKNLSVIEKHIKKAN